MSVAEMVMLVIVCVVTLVWLWRNFSHDRRRTKAPLRESMSADVLREIEEERRSIESRRQRFQDALTQAQKEQ